MGGYGGVSSSLKYAEMGFKTFVLAAEQLPTAKN